jgi:hypothetical protein
MVTRSRRAAPAAPGVVTRSRRAAPVAPGVVTRSGRAALVAAVALGVVTLGLGLLHVPLDSLARQPGLPGGATVAWLTIVVIVGTAVAVSALLAARRPGNPIGWLLLAIFFVAFSPAGDYAVLDYRLHHGTLPLGSVAVVLLADWPLWLVLIAILLWLFPDGQLPSGRWRRVSIVLLIAGVLLGLAGSAAGVAAVAGHDVQISPSGTLTSDEGGIWNLLHGAVAIGVLASWLTWLAVQVPRYRHSVGERREQLKWLYSGAVVLVVGVFCGANASGNSSDLAQVGNAINVLGFAVFSACLAVAVMKYRLYAIDRIISRVISYAVVTAVIAGVFAGVVVFASDVLPFREPVAVAASTLVAAALFNPLRKRVQRMVDRRFNRTRYQAETVVATFATRLRQTVDLDTVQGELTDAVHRAFEPTQISVWLTPAGAVSGQEEPR